MDPDCKVVFESIVKSNEVIALLELCDIRTLKQFVTLDKLVIRRIEIFIANAFSVDIPEQFKEFIEPFHIADISKFKFKTVYVTRILRAVKVLKGKLPSKMNYNFISNKIRNTNARLIEKPPKRRWTSDSHVQPSAKLVKYSSPENVTNLTSLVSVNASNFNVQDSINEDVERCPSPLFTTHSNIQDPIKEDNESSIIPVNATNSNVQDQIKEDIENSLVPMHSHIPNVEEKLLQQQNERNIKENEINVISCKLKNYVKSHFNTKLKSGKHFNVDYEKIDQNGKITKSGLFYCHLCAEYKGRTSIVRFNIIDEKNYYVFSNVSTHLAKHYKKIPKNNLNSSSFF